MAFGALATAGLDWLVRGGDLPVLVEDGTAQGMAALIAGLGHLAQRDLSFSQMLKVDRQLRALGQDRLVQAGLAPLRLAVLGSASLDHLLPGLRVAGARHGFALEIFRGDYGQYWHEIMDADGALRTFAPDAVLLALDAGHLVGEGFDPAGAMRLEETFARLREGWASLIGATGAQVIQQAALPLAPALMGGNEHRLAGSPAHLVAAFNQRLRGEADAAGVDVLALDDAAAADGLAAWHDRVLWLKARQEVSPLAAQHYGELAMRLVAARRGRSAKCLVLDLDNTLWGGVIGDDGLEGIALGQGSPEGEAFLAFQRHVLGLMERGVILAVCSKNDEANALLPFEKHPDMLLRREHITAFQANWDDKPTNLRRIAEAIGIGLDALVFVDDNPFERELVRQTLPMVRVPEMPEDAAFYAQRLARAGYFEALALTQEDAERTRLYAAKAAREAARAQATDLGAYLAGLDMVLEWQRVDSLGLARAAQLTAKTNQFNLTTRRYTQAQLAALVEDPRALVLQFRLRDRYGDNGVIAIVVATPGNADGVLGIEAWLMSCRVLGRGVEAACLAVVAQAARAMGASALDGLYLPTERNGMVRDHYAGLGFARLDDAGEEAAGATRWRLDLARWDGAAVLAQGGAIRIVPEPGA